MELRDQVLRVATTRVGPLALRLREGFYYFQEGSTYYGGGGSLKDTTPALPHVFANYLEAFISNNYLLLLIHIGPYFVNVGEW